MKKLSIIILLVFLTGCYSYYFKDGVSTRETGDDEDRCHHYCVEKHFEWNRPMSTINLEIDKCQAECMERLGYTLIKKSTSEPVHPADQNILSSPK